MNPSIRRAENEDIKMMVEIWYDSSIGAHNFIPAAYWRKHRKAMAEDYLPMSESYLIVEENEILGVISLLDNYLAALFIRPDMQAKGFGTMLLDYVKEIRGRLDLKVFCKNERSVHFYRAQGFSVISTSLDEDTGEDEYLMGWEKR